MTTHSNQLAQSCFNELTALIWFGNAFLWVALISAVLITVLTVIERLIALKPAFKENEAGGGSDTATLLDSIKGLVIALAQAPAWFAIFLAGILLLWAAPTFFGAKCILAPASANKVIPAGTPPSPARNVPVG